MTLQLTMRSADDLVYPQDVRAAVIVVPTSRVLLDGIVNASDWRPGAVQRPQRVSDESVTSLHRSMLYRYTEGPRACPFQVPAADLLGSPGS